MPTVSIHRAGADPELAEIAGPVTAGGSRADGLLLPGCPPGALRLVPSAAGIVAEALACGLRAAGHPLPPGARRLLRPGERLEVHGTAIAVEAPREEATRAAAGALLRAAVAGTAPPVGAHLVVLSGPAAGARHPLRAEQTLGRGRAATIAIPDPGASRVHARLRLLPSGPTVEDLGSKNGVRVNGVRIEGRPCPLRPGDEVRIGDTALALAPGPLAAEGPPSRAARRRAAPRLLAALLLALSAAALALAAG